MLNRSVNKQHLKIADPASEAALNALFRSYRDALPDSDGDRNFMPELWNRIESRKAQNHFFGRMSKALVTAALGASVLLGILVSSFSYQANAYFNGSYIEALAEQQPLAYSDPPLSERDLVDREWQ